MLTQLIRSIIMYIMITLALRLMGKRQIGELQPSELVITLLISELASLPMQDIGIPLAMGIVPIAVLICIEVFLSFLSLKFKPIRQMLSGRPVTVIENGKINQKNLKDLRQTVDDLLKELRQKDAFDLDSVIYAQIETNGRLSVLVAPKQNNEKESFYNVVISDGQIQETSLKNAGFDLNWLDKQLKDNNIKDIKQVFLMMADNSGKTIIQKKQDK